MAKRHYDVACGIITDAKGRVLIALRDFEADQGGLWEFPGGKVEVGEAVEEALSRELLEEIGIKLVEIESWLEVHHEYPRYHVTLHAWKVLKFEGEPHGEEGQMVRWVDLKELASLDFPEANKPIVDELVAEV